MSDLVFHLVLFVVAGIVMVAVPLIIGKLLRPKNPTPEKDAVYECGEPTIGSSFVQFDLRFYTIALLFIVFDVEVAFFFPWTAMYGNTMQLTDTELPPDARIELSEKLLNISNTRPEVHGHAIAVLKNKARLQAVSGEDGRTVAQAIQDSVNSRNEEFWQKAEKEVALRNLPKDDGFAFFLAFKQDALLEALATELDVEKSDLASRYITASDARSFGWLAFADIAVFFGVLLVGFAYVWKRGDLEWVRAVS